ncbi:MAG: hypothetical protein EXR78_04680 [Deltaproteobacteria bacterium]|nr:hypothetical protein [Deltaproteobacteria bacterium]
MPPPPKTNQFATRRTATRQPVRLLTAHEKPRPCDWPTCSKSATGADENKAYCPTHFFAAVHKHW